MPRSRKPALSGACELLKEPARKLYEVGACVGYTNGKYFTRVFHKRNRYFPAGI